jgi:hypothetical protein
MIGAKRLVPAVVALLVTASAAWSQPATEADSEAATSSPQQDPGADADTSTSNRADYPADNGDAAADTTPPQAGRPPGDYRPSEQISEDLSVSFPVDI